MLSEISLDLDEFYHKHQSKRYSGLTIDYRPSKVYNLWLDCCMAIAVAGARLRAGYTVSKGLSVANLYHFYQMGTQWKVM